MTEFLTWMHGNPDKMMMTGAVLIALAGLGLVIEAVFDKRKIDQ